VENEIGERNREFAIKMWEEGYKQYLLRKDTYGLLQVVVEVVVLPMLKHINDVDSLVKHWFDMQFSEILNEKVQKFVDEYLGKQTPSPARNLSIVEDAAYWMRYMELDSLRKAYGGKNIEPT
jgi:acyl carrier protein phosphodiesterase